MKQTIKKQIRIPFTLESLKNPNAQFVMRNGTPVENIQFSDDHFNFYDLYAEVDGEIFTWTNDGDYLGEHWEAPEDIFELLEIEVEVDCIKKIDFNEDEIAHLLFVLQSVQDGLGDKKFFPEDSELKKSYNQQLQSWINQAESLYKKILLERWIELPTPPDEVYGSLTDEYLQYLTNQNK